MSATVEAILRYRGYCTECDWRTIELDSEAVALIAANDHAYEHRREDADV